MSVGHLFAIVGPSGVGKDSLMAGAVAALPQLSLVRRVITRPSDAGGEDFDGVTSHVFSQMQARGDFALSWSAHGLSYGLPISMLTSLAQGKTLLANFSRGALGRAQHLFPLLEVIEISANRETLAKRLAARGRETPEVIAGRLRQAEFVYPSGMRLHRVENDGALQDAIAQICTIVQPESAIR